MKLYIQIIAMSQLNMAKQRLMQKSNSALIAEPTHPEPTSKVFKKNNLVLSIPKLQINKQNEISPGSEYETSLQLPPKGRNSPQFAKTQRSATQLNKSDRSQIMSEKADHTNILRNKGAKTRRTAEYTKTPGSNNLGPPNLSFTDHEPSLKNQSPPKTVRSTVHVDNLNLVPQKPPLRKAISPLKPNQCSLPALEKYISEEKAKPTAFTDGMFPPSLSVIFNKKYGCVEEGLKMERLSKIYEGVQLRMIKNCQPTLLQPGMYTSPALYCALGILSQEPSRVLSLIGNQQLNQKGIYYVQLCKDGVWRFVIVDDYMPVKLTTKRTLLFLHMQPRNNLFEFWPCLIEKAIAKVYGTYQDVYLTAERGVKDLLLLLTGLPVSEYSIGKDFRTFLVVIDAAIKKNQIVVLEGISEEVAQAKDMAADHSYQIIEVKKSSILVRNLMSQDLTTRLSFEEAMVFSKLMIFRSESNYVYVSRTLRHKQGCYSVVRVTIKASTKCYWEIWENSEVYYKAHIGSQIDYRKSFFTIKIKREGKEEQCSESGFQEQIISESGKEVTLGAGCYEVWVHLCQAREQDFTLSYYGEEDVQLVRVKNKEKWPSQCSCS